MSDFLNRISKILGYKIAFIYSYNYFKLILAHGYLKVSLEDPRILMGAFIKPGLIPCMRNIFRKRKINKIGHGIAVCTFSIVPIIHKLFTTVRYLYKRTLIFVQNTIFKNDIIAATTHFVSKIAINTKSKYRKLIQCNITILEINNKT